MLNLSAAELRDSSRAAFNEDDYIIKGGWPELYSRPDIEPHFWYASYLSTIKGYIASRASRLFSVSENVFAVPGSDIDQYLS